MGKTDLCTTFDIDQQKCFQKKLEDDIQISVGLAYDQVDRVTVRASNILVVSKYYNNDGFKSLLMTIKNLKS